ncbi:MAG: hypothetical protein M3O36_09945, partial [Myxococcota bacterium]|nr:hypothetical protein [Myxococcota bacterium]
MNPENVYSRRSALEEGKLHGYRATTDFFAGAGMQSNLRRLEPAGTGPTCVVDGRERVMLGSCNYLGMATHPS